MGKVVWFTGLSGSGKSTLSKNLYNYLHKLDKSIYKGIAVVPIPNNDLGKTIKEQRFMRICPEPYVCIVPPENWKARPPLGLTVYKRIPV